jgi:hypothetical protein
LAEGAWAAEAPLVLAGEDWDAEWDADGG